MKILFLQAYFEPERVASPYLGENKRQAYADAGFDMVLYTPVPTRGVTDEVRRAYKSRLREQALDGRLQIRRFPLMREGKNPLLRALRYFLCTRRLYKAALKEPDADVLAIASTPPFHLQLMHKLKKKRPGIRIVYNLQDIFPDSLVHTGLAGKGSLLWKLGRRMEDRGYAAADKIVVISEDFRQNILAKGVPEDKIVLIRNWVDEKAVRSVPRGENPLFDAYGLDRGRFYVCYSGNVGLTQNMDLLLDVAKQLADVPGIGFIIVGEGAYKPQVEKRIREEQISNVTLLPFQPYEKISDVFSLGDCGLIISKAGVGSNSVPSKTWSIMAAARPVLACFDKGSELDRIVTETGCGVCTPAGDADAFRDAVLRLYRDRDALAAMGDAGRRYIEQNLTRAIGTAKWIDVMRQVCGC
ncbi:MAG: glycosyltransferase family 4 protein [Clostridia bacterium]|nr:glycosyltransferase family 4 protein [Clostridia bacterium]